MELLVVLAVAVLLTGLLFPAMAQVRENAHRVICMSNLRQMAVGFNIYEHDHGDNLPYAFWVDREINGDNVAPWELMSSRHGASPMPGGWDGLGLLYFWGYCSAPDCYYCPSHHGDHPLDRYENAWQQPGGLEGEPGPPNAWHQSGGLEDDAGPLYTNYHYAGHADWVTGAPRRLIDGDRLVLVTDGMRTRRDFNHGTGMNMLLGDGSVQWDEQVQSIVDRLPEGIDGEIDDLADYGGLWDIVSALR